MDSVRIFLSSPTDVSDERACVRRVIEKLSTDWADRLSFDLIDWNDRYYTAGSSFQKQMAQPAECELVICIFWKRLGTDLPDEYRREDGTLPTGSEFEFENAIEGAGKHAQKIPDVLVYRKTADVTFSVDHFDLEKAEYERFLIFWRRWFRNEQGHFTAGFRNFKTLSEFETVFERNFSKWLVDRHGTVEWTKGNPFRGLNPFTEEYSGVFFGRRREIERARARLVASALAGHPVLLLIGASGSGKSSLVRAGLVPRLKMAGGLPTYAIVASATVSPGEIGGDFASGLAKVLFESALGPSLARGDSPTVEALARVLAAGEAGAGAIIGALNRFTSGEIESDGSDATALVLVVDQLEEIFSWPPERAERFLLLLEALVASRRVILLATMRSDFQHRMAEIETLARLVGCMEVRAVDNGERVLEIAAPKESEIHEMIERPAAAAGLTFQIHDGRDLSALVKSEARADSMPAIALLLQQLYEAREGELLTLAAYDRLGGVSGVMARHGESVLAMLEPEQLAAFPVVVRALVTQVRPGAPITIRRVGLAAFAEQPAALAIVRALVDAGLIVSDREMARFAHDSVLEGWKRVKDLVDRDQRLFDARERLERDCARWAALRNSRRERTASLLRGLSLEEARELLAKWGPAGLQDKEPLLPVFIEESIARARWVSWRLSGLLLAVIAVVSAAFIYAEGQRRETQISLWLANAQNDLREGNTMQALDASRRAFDAKPSVQTRSGFLGALMTLSPYYVGRIDLGDAFAQALTWTDSATLTYGDSANMLRDYSLTADISASKRPIPVAPNQESPPKLVAIEPLASATLLGVLSDGSLIEARGRTAGIRVFPAGALRDISTGSRSAVGMSPDGSTIVIAPTADSPVVLSCSDRRPSPPQCVSRALSPSFANAVGIDRRSGRIAVVDSDGNLSVFGHDGATQGSKIPVGGRAISLDWNPRDGRLAIGLDDGHDGRLILADLDHPKALASISSKGAVSAVAWSPRGDLLAYACDQSTVCVADGRTLEAQNPQIVRFVGQPGRITRIAWAQDGEHLASADDGHSIVIWSIHPNQQVYFDLPLPPSGRPAFLAGSPDGRWLAAARDDGGVDRWDTGKLDAAENLKRASSTTAVLAWGDAGTLAGIYADATVATWRRQERSPRQEQMRVPPPELIRPGELAWLDAQIAYVSQDNRIMTVDPRLPRPQSRWFARARRDMRAEAIATDASHTMLVASYEGGRVVAWDPARDDPIELPTAGPVAAQGIAVRNDRRYVATTGGDPFVNVYELGSRTLWRRLELEKDEPSGAIAFNSDGSRLAAIDAKDVVYVWDFSERGATRVLRVNVQPQLGMKGAIGAGYSSYLTWVGPDKLAVLTAQNAVRILDLDERDWRKRMDALQGAR